MDKVWREQFTLRSTEIDFAGRLKINSLFQIMQEAAEHSADHLGFGYDYVRANNEFWVLSKVSLEIFRTPGWQETIRVETWPKGMDRIFSMRDFQFYDASNTIWAQATTAWLLLSTTTNRIVRHKEFPDANGLFALNYPPPKLKTDQPFSLVYEKHIQISDLDVNNHVNNANYLGWVIDALDYQLYKTHAITRVDINYIHETKFGETVVISKTEYDTAQKSLYIDAHNPLSGQLLMRARVTLKSW